MTTHSKQFIHLLLFTLLIFALNTTPPVHAQSTTKPSTLSLDDLQEDAMNFSNSRIRLNAALENLQDEYYEEAIPELEDLLAEDPTLEKAWEALGWSYWKTGHKDRTIRLWKRFLFLDPTQTKPYNLLAEAALANNHLEEAIGYYRKSLQIDPDQYQVKYNLARALRWSGQNHEAAAILKKMHQEDPNRNDVTLELARSLSTNWDYEEALPLWQRLREKAPQNTEYTENVATALLHTGDREGAMAELDILLREDPNNSTALEVAANAAELSDKPEDARAPLRKLMNLQTTTKGKERIRVRLLRLLVRLNEKDSAAYGLEEPIKLAKERIEDFPHSIDAKLLLGELYTMDGQLKKAEAPFLEVLENDNPYNLRAFRGMFQVESALKNYNEAWEYLGKIAAFNPYDPYLHYNEAQLHAARGDFFKAREALDKLEKAGSRGAISCLLYHGLTPSPYFVDALYTERFRDHLRAMNEAGFEFVRATNFPALLGPMRTDDTGTLDSTPTIKVFIDFDDGRRDSMKYGTEIANEFGMVFSMHLPVDYIANNNPFICSWDQLRAYKKTGCWEYGSHLLTAATLARTNAGGRLIHALPNRKWLPNEGREQTRDEYLAWLTDEFFLSRKILQEELGGSFNFASYPFGDIGQEDITNVKDPTQTILLQAYGAYDAAFIQSTYGYAVAGDNPLLYQRNEIDRWRSGSNLVERIYKYHPVFLARVTRAQLAALEGKQYLALKNIDKLKKSGYTASLLEEIKTYVHHHLAGKMGKVQAEGDKPEDHAFWDVDLREPSVGARIEYARDNQKRQQWRLSACAGLNLTQALELKGSGGIGGLKQEVVTTNNPGLAQGQKLKIDEKSVGLQTTYTFVNGIYLLGKLGWRDYSGDAKQSITPYSFEAQFRPFLAMDAMLRYEYDMVPTALAVYKNISSKTPSGYALFRLRDWWTAQIAAARYDYSDDNNRSHANIGTTWTLWDRPGLHFGLNYAYASAPDEEEAYWTPYKLNRYFAETGFRGTHRLIYYDLKLRLGVGREKVRPAAQEAYEENLARSIEQQWEIPPTEPEENWESVLGISLSLKIPYRKVLMTRFSSSYNKLPNYDELRIDASVELMF